MIPKIMKTMPIIYLLTLTVSLWIGAATANACDACNISFTEEIKNDRAQTPAGRDILRAMENQRGLPLDGLGAKYYLAADRTAETSSITADQPEARPAPTPRFKSAEAPAVAAKPVSRPVPAYFEDHPFIEIIERDYGLPIPPTSMVPQDAPVDKTVTIRLQEGKTYIGNNVVYDGFITDGKIPGPTIIVDQDDVVEFVVINEGRIPHGASIHSADTQTSKYVGSIGPGETKRVVFKATQPGIFMYHCAPGGHAIPMHVLFGQYGMMVVRPKHDQYQLEKDLGHGPDLELFLLQHEIYASGKDAIEGNAAYTMFNGKLFRYVEEPIMVRPGDYVRINFLNVGPNLLSTFHIVGIIWDYVYWQGNPSEKMKGGQTVTAGPSDSFVIEFRMPPDEGAYTMLSHAVGSTSRGAIGLLVVDGSLDETPVPVITADGPEYSDAEMRAYTAEAQRVVSPSKPGTHPTDLPVVYGPETKEVAVSIIGNSYYPKVIQVAPGTTVTWTNEDVFTFLAGEYSGVHNVMGTSAPPDSDGLVGPLLGHGETFSHTFEEEWDYEYICTPHPYMVGRVIVKEPEYTLGDGQAATATLGGWALPLLGLCLVLSSLALVRSRRNR